MNEAATRFFILRSIDPTNPKMIPATFVLEDEYHLHTIKSLDSSPSSFCWFSSTKNGGFLKVSPFFHPTEERAHSAPRREWTEEEWEESCRGG